MVSVGAWRRNDSNIGARVDMTRSKVDRRDLGDAKPDSSSLENEDFLDMSDSVSHSDSIRSESCCSILAAISTRFDVVDGNGQGWLQQAGSLRRHMNVDWVKSGSVRMNEYQ